MTSLTVVSPCYYGDVDPCKKFIESCERFNLTYHLYGLGEPWPWLYEAKVIRLILEVEELSSEYIMICDGDDAFFLSGQKEIMSKYLASNAKILVSADRVQEEGDAKFPQYLFRDRYPVSSTPWRYCNSGGYIGKKDDILDLLSAMDNVKNPPYMSIYRSKDWNNDQFRMSLVYLQGYDGLIIDTGCNLFQTMGCVKKNEIKYLESRVVNTVTNTRPCVVHFNGNAPGIDEAYEQCTEQITTL